MIYTRQKEKEVRIIDLKKGDVFRVSGKEYSFNRIKRGGKSMVVTQLDNEKDYRLVIHDIFNDTKNVIGKAKLKVKKKEQKNSLSIKDIKINENVVIMTGRNNQVPQLYKLVEIKKGNKYSHVFMNPVTKRRENFNSNDSWKVYKLDELLK